MTNDRFNDRCCCCPGSPVDIFIPALVAVYSFYRRLPMRRIRKLYTQFMHAIHVACLFILLLVLRSEGLSLRAVLTVQMSFCPQLSFRFGTIKP